MNVIRIENSRLEKLLHLPEVTRKLPSHWNQLTQQQLLIVAAAIFNLPREQAQMAIFTGFMGLKWHTLRLQFKLWAATAEQIHDIIQTFSFIFEENNLTRWVMPQVGKFIGPVDKLTTSSLMEFCTADTYFLKYRKTGSAETLCKFLACLYRPVSSENQHKIDPRETFDANLCSARESSFRKVPENVKMGIVINWLGVREHIVNLHPRVFPKSNESKVKEGSATWGDLIIEMAGDDLTRVEPIGRNNLYLALRFLEKTIERNHAKK